MLSFGARLSAVFATVGHLCVGIDPHPYLLAEWRLPDTADGVREFGLRVVEATATVRGTAASSGIVKPQVAFFERHGSAGYRSLELVLAAARDAGLLVIADAKRGDLGTSVEAYGQAWLTPGSPLEADAVTMSAFQGVGSIAAPLRLAAEHGKGVFVLAATSNQEAHALQTARMAAGTLGSRTVAAGIVSDVKQWNSTDGLGSIGVVIGATVDLSDYGIDPAELRNTPILAPGIGHQGASAAELEAVFGAATPNLVVNASRSILGAGHAGLRQAISSQAAELAEVFAR